MDQKILNEKLFQELFDYINPRAVEIHLVNRVRKISIIKKLSFFEKSK